MSTPSSPNVTVATRTVVSIALLSFFGCVSKMFGEYIREAAVLLLVFIPLDLWKHSEITKVRVLEVIVTSIGSLAFGMMFEFIGLLCKRVQKGLEGEQR